jgi:hypothetical protein
MSAVSARQQAVQRLVDICDQPRWDPVLIVRRGAVPVLLRKALRAAQHDPDLLAEVYALWPVASGTPEPLIDAAIVGIADPDSYRTPPVPTFDPAELEEALR